MIIEDRFGICPLGDAIRQGIGEGRLLSFPFHIKQDTLKWERRKL